MRMSTSYWRGTRGVSAIEFALVAPVLVLLSVGLAELARYGIFRQQIADTATTTVDLVARLDPSETSDIDTALALATSNLSPLASGGGIRVIASGVEWQEDGISIAWQRVYGDLEVESEIGVLGNAANVPAGLVDQEILALVTVELSVDYRPWFMTRITGHVARDTAYTRPRRDRDLDY